MDRLERISGCMLGGAVGDALGAPVEFMSLYQIQTKFGSSGIEHYAYAYGSNGAITDDTQMTLFTLEGILNSGTHPDAASLVDSVRLAYIRWLGTQGRKSKAESLAQIYNGGLWKQELLHSPRAPGAACVSSLRKHMARMENGDLAIPREPINDSKGCGGVMRMAPVDFFDIDCFQVGCELAKLTHGHPSGYLASGFLAHMIHELMHGASLTEAIGSARNILIQWPSHDEVLEAVDRAIAFAESREPRPECIEELGGGWVAEEALGISLFCALKAEGFASGVRLAVNHGGDSDSTGAITGNILGAMWGRQAIPDEFLEELELRDVIEKMASDAAKLDLHMVKSDTETVPFPRSYWVQNGDLLAGCYPGDIKAAKATKKLNALLDHGIRTILSLMEEDEKSHNGNTFVQYEDEFLALAKQRGLDASCIRFPIRDMTVPTRDEMKSILDAIDKSIADNRPVFVHCWGGKGRTGTVVGCWLVRHGVAVGDEALERIQHLRRNEERANEDSPQTPAQNALVRSWKQGE